MALAKPLLPLQQRSGQPIWVTKPSLCLPIQQHSLGDSLDVKLGPSPVKVSENLWGQEVSVFGDLNLNWDVVREHFAHLMESRGIEGVYAEEMGVLPGMEELFSLSYIKRYNEQQEYDLLVVDCAPTEQTLRSLLFAS